MELGKLDMLQPWEAFRTCKGQAWEEAPGFISYALVAWLGEVVKLTLGVALASREGSAGCTEKIAGQEHVKGQFPSKSGQT